MCGAHSAYHGAYQHVTGTLLTGVIRVDTVYGYVPAGVVRALTIKHGGVIEGTLPEFDMNAEQSCFLAEALLEVVNESR